MTKIKKLQIKIYEIFLIGSFSKNTLTPWQPLRCSMGSVLWFSQCLSHVLSKKQYNCYLLSVLRSLALASSHDQLWPSTGFYFKAWQGQTWKLKKSLWTFTIFLKICISQYFAIRPYLSCVPYCGVDDFSPMIIASKKL